MKKILFLSLLFGLFSLFNVQGGEYSADWQAFEKEIDKAYPFFELKGIKGVWNKEKKSLAKKADACKSDEEFLEVVVEGLSCLRDAHAGFKSTRVPMAPREDIYCLPLALMPGAKNTVVVMAVDPKSAAAELTPGTVIKSINGRPAEKLLTELAKESWKKGGAFSSPQRAALYTYRLPMAKEQITEFKIAYLKEGKEGTITLKNEQKAQGWAHTYNMPKNLKRGDGSVLYCQLPSEIGYIYLRRIQGANTEKGVSTAFSEYPSAPAWIVDLRGNGGGGYDASLTSLFQNLTVPVAVIIDAGCISAGETLARDLKIQKKATLFGSVTAGSSSAKKTWDFPSGVASLILSTRSRNGLDKKPIEFHGISPDINVLPLPEEVAQGLNSEIIQAEKYLLQAVK